MRKTERNKRTIIDVRSPEEYNGGHAENSVNIPLSELEMRVDEIEKMPKPILLCCASGMRSARGCQLLKELGVEECYDGGSWISVSNFQIA